MAIKKLVEFHSIVVFGSLDFGAEVIIIGDSADETACRSGKLPPIVAGPREPGQILIEAALSDQSRVHAGAAFRSCFLARISLAKNQRDHHIPRTDPLS